MSIRISGVNLYNRQTNYLLKNNITFRGLSKYKNVGFALGTAALLSFSSCKQPSPNDIVDILTTVENNDSMNSTIHEYKFRDERCQKHYHYFPKNNDDFSSSNYDWVETIYPDGRIEKDSLGYQISITPEGERTVVKTEKDDNGNTVITTTLPDGSKIVRTEYNPTIKGEILSVRNKYWPSGKIKEITYLNEYPSDSTNINSKKITEKENLYYSENEVLLKWETTKIDPERNIKYNKYDHKKRLIYDDIKNEKYQYKGNSKTPYRSISIYDDCKRITLYDKEGNVEKIYFKASDGTITE